LIGSGWLSEYNCHIPLPGTLNIHGAIFERWAADVVRKSGSWRLTATEYPVEYPPPESGARGYETALDLKADVSYGDGSWLIALIECKKNNPEFVDWVFFEANRVTPSIPNLWAHQIRWGHDASGTHRTPTIVSFEYPPSGLVADHASETRGSYDDPKTRKKNTRTSTHAINDACHQVAIATQAIVHEEQSKLLGHPESMQTVMTFMPLIVTTARLHVLEFDPSKVSAETGEIPRKDARLKPVQALQYLNPIPRHLQFGGGPIPGTSS
jgi:hypothetical protein